MAGALTLDARRVAGLATDYESDVTATRRALDAVERDVRCASDVRVDAHSLVAGDVTWQLAAGALRRGDEIIARNVSAFETNRSDDLVNVTIELGRRSPDATRTARVTTSVRLRAPRESVK